MSDQTPDALGQGSSVADPMSNDPSMEDILASIRRIISDEESDPSLALDTELPELGTDILELGAGEPSLEPTAVETSTDMQALDKSLEDDFNLDDILLLEESVGDVTDVDLELPNFDGDELSIPSVMDAPVEAATSSVEPEKTSADLSLVDLDAEDDVVMSFAGDSSDDIWDDLSKDIDLIIDDIEADDVTSVEAVAQPVDTVSVETPPASADALVSTANEASISGDLLDIDLVLLGDDAEDTLISNDDNVVSSFLDEDFGVLSEETAEPASSLSETDDIDLVKALMADLTDEDEDEVSVSDSSLEIDTASPVSFENDLSLEAFIDDGEAASQDAETEELDESINALLAIAAAAEADAERAGQEREIEPLIEPTLVEAQLEPAAEVEQIETLGTVLASLDDEDMTLVEAVTPAEEVALHDDIIAQTALEVESITVSPDQAVAELDEILIDVPEVQAQATEIETVTLADNTPQFDVPQIDTPEIDTQEEGQAMASNAVNESILSEVTQTASVEAFASLNQVVEDKTDFEMRGPRIGDLIQDTLKPMLKEWLDENLQGIVERAVQKEIKRISSGK